MLELGAKALDARGVNSELHIVDLVAGKDQVRDPEYPRGRTKLSCHHVISSRSGRRQADNPDNFGEHSSRSSQLF